MTDPTPPTVELLTGKQKAIIGGLLSNLVGILVLVGTLTTGTVSVVCLAAAGLVTTIGVPWGIYVAVNPVKSLTVNGNRVV